MSELSADLLALEWFSQAPLPRAHLLEWLHTQLGCMPDIQRGAHGKPLLVGRNEGISVSHCAGQSVYALARVAVGVDIERVDRPLNWQRLSARVLSPSEQILVEQAAQPSVKFLQFWSAKEALAKADGRGLQIGFKRLDLSALNLLKPWQIEVDSIHYQGAPIQRAECSGALVLAGELVAGAE